MLLFLLVALCFYISLRDIAAHRIDNASNLSLFLLLSIDRNTESLRVTIIALICNLAFSILFRFGGGDFKLFSVLILTQGEVLISTLYLQLFAVFATISFMISAAARRSFSGAVPMAPAILTPFLIGYLAI